MDTYDGRMAEQFADLLNQREDELRLALRALYADNEAAAPYEVSDFKDLALRSTDASADEHQAARLSQQLRQVASARRRLATEGFGRCQDCGHAINLRRLLLVPEAELCTSCQSVKEPHRQ